ncbi:TPR domain-containing glycosyltransferase [Alicyclobacillus sp. ALC3]|uniref:TPR domain-containing glycosyltransferase n=1 Tax=Alicyclobacillus sp. ALC3 TaxID=2796143 RepID=UPI002378A23E|nr:TPR domain-containing glycosyltransferase [Alicyclobacillus sp. ALC3]WDL95238.1 glycosyltransferase [Alicyclobacillus sp. ALC3]
MTDVKHADVDEIVERVKQSLVSSKWVQAKSDAIEGIKLYPRSAQLWVFLGEALEHMNDKAAAWRAYDRGWLLDPQAAWATPMEARVGAFRHAKAPKWIEELLQVKNVTVAAAIIVKNEERTIGEAIQKLKPAVDEIVIVDTGSTDRTLEIIRENGVEPYSFEWVDDFAAARNFALSKVTCDWVVCVDADELLVTDDVEAVRTAAGVFDDDYPIILRVVQVNHIGQRTDPNFDMSRMFPTRFGLRFWGRIHEQVGPPEGGPMSVIYSRPVVRIRFDHDGYEPAISEEKGRFDRNIDLLRKCVEDDPRDIASWGFLGRELLFTGKKEEAIAAFYETEKLAPDFPTYARMPEVRMYLVDILLAEERFEEALEVSRRAVTSDTTFPGGWYGKGRTEIQYALKLLANAQQSMQQARTTANTYRGVVSFSSDISSWRPTAALGDIARLQGNMVEALRHYEQALQISPGNPIVQQMLTNIEQQTDQLASVLQGRASVGSSFAVPAQFAQGRK